MIEKRFFFVIDNGDYTFYDLSENGEIMNMNETEDMLNELNDENEELKQLIEDKNQIQQETLQQLVQTQKELQTIKNTIKEMHKNERTHLGHNVLSQLIEAIQ